MIFTQNMFYMCCTMQFSFPGQKTLCTFFLSSYKQESSGYLRNILILYLYLALLQKDLRHF